MPAVKTSEIKGGKGGDTDYYTLPGKITSITVSWVVFKNLTVVESLSVTSNHGTEKINNVSNTANSKTFTFAQDEEITEVFGKYGDYVDSIGFKTNKQTYAAVGGSGGANQFNLTGKVVGFVGKRGSVIDSVGIRYYEADHSAVDTHLNTAIDHFEQLHPHHGDIKATSTKLKEQVSSKTAPAIILKANEAAKSTPVQTGMFGLTKCEEALLFCGVNIVFFVVGLMGLHTSNQQRVARAVLRELGTSTLNGWRAAIHNIANATSTWDRMKEIFSFMGSNLNVFKIAIKEMFSDMGWWEYTKTVVVCIAQIVAWIATDGIAFIALAVLNAASAIAVVESAKKAVECC